MAQAPSKQPHALRVVVRFHDEVVVDELFRRRTRPVEIGPFGDVILPPPHGARQLALVHFEGRARARVQPAEGDHYELTPDASQVLGFDGIEVSLHLVPQFRLPRPPLLAESDFGLALSILAMVVLALQVELFLSLFGTRPNATEVGVEPSPELIARLLREDFDGADEGFLVRPESRLAAEKDHPSFYMPAGGRGPADQLGGAQDIAPEPVRTHNQERPEPPDFQPLPTDRALIASPDGSATPIPPIPGVMEVQELRVREDDAGEEAKREPVSAEEDRGWGFYAWYDAEDARDDDAEIRQEILHARRQLAIDPEDPYALQTLGYYQYLADLYEECRETYERFIELYPDEPSGYNNLALVYKRGKQYRREEGYYRLALALTPEDDHALNNLAVNLAHQGRHAEALEIMGALEVMTPDDPYADLHRSKIYASMDDDDRALEFLQKALAGMAALDTLHHIEFRADIRVDPAFDKIRSTPPFRELLLRYYGDDAHPLTRAGGSDG